MSPLAYVVISLPAGLRVGDDEERVISDETVRPGFLGFAVFLVLVAATFFLVRSMNRQLKKVPPTFDEPATPPVSSDPVRPDEAPPDDEVPPDGRPEEPDRPRG